jgi:hypothetical protein
LDLSREWNGSRSGKGLSEPRKHCQVGMHPNPVKAASAERRQTVLVFQASELALDGSAATVKPLPLIGAVRGLR